METIRIRNRGAPGDSPVVGPRLDGAVVYALDENQELLWSNSIWGAVNASVHEWTSGHSCDFELPTTETGEDCGLTGEYFVQPGYFSGTSVSRPTPSLRFPFGAANYEIPYDTPDPITTPLGMTAAFTGRIKADHTEDYTLRVVIDNEVIIFLDGVQIFHQVTAEFGNDFSEANHLYATAAIPMTADEWRDIEVRSIDYGGGVTHLRVMWESSSTPLEDIPACNMRPY